MDEPKDLVAVTRLMQQLLAQQMALMTVVRVMVQHHPNPSAMQAAAPAALEHVKRSLLFSPLSETALAVADSTMRALLGMPETPPPTA